MADGGDKDVKQTQAAVDEGKQATKPTVDEGKHGGDKETKPVDDAQEVEGKQTEGKQAAKATPTDDRYQKYREAYIRERLRTEKVKEGAEMDAALSFVTDRLDDDDTNFDDVMRQLKVRMRLDKRKQYVDPSPVNPGVSYTPQQRDLTDVGREMFKNLKKKGLIR